MAYGVERRIQGRTMCGCASYVSIDVFNDYFFPKNDDLQLMNIYVYIIYHLLVSYIFSMKNTR